MSDTDSGDAAASGGHEPHADSGRGALIGGGIVGGLTALLLVAGAILAATAEGPVAEEVEAVEPTAPATEAPPEPTATPAAPTPVRNVPGLALYTNLEVGYEILYPEGWRIDDEDPYSVVFEPRARNGQMLVDAIKGGPQQPSVSALLDRVLENTQQTMRGVQEVGRRELDLAAGQAGVIELIYDNPRDAGGPIHSNLMLVLTDDRLYQVEVAILEDQYSDEFAQQVNDMLASFTVPK